MGYQQMRVGTDANDSTIDNALSEAALFDLSKTEAIVEAAHVSEVCARWKAHFAQAGVADREIGFLSQYVDREFLLAQRRELAETGPGRRKTKH